MRTFSRVWGRPAFAAALAVALALPSLGAPLLQDDVVHRLILEERLPGITAGPLELYDFVGAPGRPASLFREHGYLPWFVEEDLTLRFFRPLSSALLAADWHLFGEALWAARLHTLGWFLVVLGLTRALHRRILPPATAGLATVIYAVAEAHTLPLSWLAARHALVASAFGLGAVWLHLRARQDGWTPGRWLSPLALAAAFLAGELALGAVAIIAAWELVGRDDAVRARIRALLPGLALGAGYLAFYATAGYGARGGGAYVGFDSGLEGAVTALRHLLLYAGELTAATPSDAFAAGTTVTQAAGALWGGAVLAAAAVLFRIVRIRMDPRERAAFGWLPVAAFGAALPGALAVPGGRVLPLALVPASAAVAALLHAGISTLRAGSDRGARRAFVAVVVAGLALGHLVAGPVLRVMLARVLMTMAAGQALAAAAAPACSGVMIMPAVADPGVAIYVPALMMLHGRGPERLRVLSMAPVAHRIESVTRSGFELVVVDRAREWTLWERVYRRRPLPAGTRVVIGSLDATVLEDAGGVPTRLRADFGEPLDSPHLCFYQWRNGALVRLRVPRPGDTLHLGYEWGPGGM